MSEPNFNLLTLPDFVLAEIDERICALRNELPQRNAGAMIEPLQRLTKIRGHFAFDNSGFAAFGGLGAGEADPVAGGKKPPRRRHRISGGLRDRGGQPPGAQLGRAAGAEACDRFDGSRAPDGAARGRGLARSYTLAVR